MKKPPKNTTTGFAETMNKLLTAPVKPNYKVIYITLMIHFISSRIINCFFHFSKDSSFITIERYRTRNR